MCDDIIHDMVDTKWMTINGRLLESRYRIGKKVYTSAEGRDSVDYC